MRNILSPAAQHRGPHWRLKRISLIPAVMALIGITMFFYPDAAAWIAQYNQSQVIKAYEDQVNNAEPDATEQIRMARQYNDALSAGAIIEANTNKPRGTGSSADPSFEYENLLRATPDGLMARIRIPSISVDMPIYHGTDEKTLLTGAGHLKGTSLPVGGRETRTVITAHRGLAEAEMFTNLDKIGIDDTFSLEVFGEVLTYKVVNTEVIEPDQTEALRAQQGRDLATLITCTPLGINSHRILVTGERVIPTPERDMEQRGATPDVPFFPWWAVFYAISVTFIGMYVWWAGRPRGARRRRTWPGGIRGSQNPNPDPIM